LNKICGKGCGGVMRAAPAGLLYGKDEAFQIADDLFSQEQ